MTKSPISKLFKLKQWLTLPDAGKHLSGIFGEEIKERDILRLALDGELKLSILLGNHTSAKLGNARTLDEIEAIIEKTKELPSILPILDGKIEALSFEKEVQLINGVWDVTLYGQGRSCLEVEWDQLNRVPSGPYVPYQHKINGSEFYMGVIVTKNDIYAQLQTGKALTLCDEEREAFLDSWTSRAEHENFCPTSSFPNDSMLVVRTDALREFEQLISEENAPPKPHGNSEANAQKREQILGAALSVLANWPEFCKNNSSGEIEATKIRRLIEEKALLFWKETGEPPLGTEKIEREIRKWLNTVK